VNRFVVDASVVLSWCFPDENIDLAQHVAGLFKQGDIAVAPSFWPHEVLNALLAGEKRKRISKDLVQGFLDDLATLPSCSNHLQPKLFLPGFSASAASTA